MKLYNMNHTLNLPGSPYVWQEAVIIQPPDTMTSRGLKLVHILELPNDLQVLLEDDQHQGTFLFFVWVEESQQRQDTQEQPECELVACPIVDPTKGAKGL